MDLNEYQKLANKTSVFPKQYLMTYPIIGLAGEVGELANKYKKVLRGDPSLGEVYKQMEGELGDILWYVAAIATSFGWDLSQVAEANIAKLKDRKDRNMIKGAGDGR